MTMQALSLQALSFPVLIPQEGFRWICRDDDDGHWRAAEPPADWSKADYLAASPLEDDPPPKPELSSRLYLAASLDELLEAHSQQKTSLGHLVTEPDLYLQFASEKGKPQRLKELANKFGLLDGSLQHSHQTIKVKRSESFDLEEAFSFHHTSGDLLHLLAEPAQEWLNIFALARSMIREWKKLHEARDIAEMGSFLKDAYNYALGGSLTYQLELNEQTGEAQSRIICSSLRHYIDVQWGMSIAANVLHRQCAECPNWFSIHPATSRPEKLYCSDACRMRAYRKRKGSIAISEA